MRYWPMYGTRLFFRDMKTNCSRSYHYGGARQSKEYGEAFSNRTKIEKGLEWPKKVNKSERRYGGTEKDGTSNTIIALLGAGKKTVANRAILKPVQVPLFDESGENVEDKRKEKKKQPGSNGNQKAEEEEKLRKSHF